LADDEQTRVNSIKCMELMLQPMSNVFRLLGLKVDNKSNQEVWTITGDRIRMPLDVKIAFHAPDFPPRYSCEAVITAESDPGPVEPARDRSWRIIGVRLFQGMDMYKRG